MIQLQEMIEEILRCNTRIILGDYILYKQHNQIRLFSSISEMSIPYDEDDPDMMEFLSRYQDVIAKEYNKIKKAKEINIMQEP